MIYIFSFPTHFKIGYAKCPWKRLQRGFWHLSHPVALCGRLDRAELVFLFEGELRLEQGLHCALGPEVGEFYPNSRLDDVMSLLRTILVPVPFPVRPPLYFQAAEMKPCCGGEHGGFQREDHQMRSLACKGKTSECERCKRQISIRRDHRENHAKRCKGESA